MIVHIIRLIDWVDRSIDLPAACLLSELNDDNNQLVSDDSDDEDVEYKGHFCSGCSIPHSSTSEVKASACALLFGTLDSCMDS